MTPPNEQQLWLVHCIAQHRTGDGTEHHDMHVAIVETDEQSAGAQVAITFGKVFSGPITIQHATPIHQVGGYQVRIERATRQTDALSKIYHVTPASSPQPAPIDRLQTLQDAIDTWGAEAQLHMAVEECSELINAIQKYWRQRVKRSVILEEIADVRIMCDQLEMIVGGSAAQIEAEKLTRLRKRLDEARKAG